MIRFLSIITVVALLCLGATPGVSAQDTCYADMDVDGNGLPLSVADYILALRYLAGDTTLPVEPWHLDLNGDCAVDNGDLELMACYFVSGLSCFGGVYPVPTCCNPEMVTGACCLPGDSCSQRTLGNCVSMGGVYMGDGTACSSDSCDCCEYRGDIDHSGTINISDVTFIVAYLFAGGSQPPCLAEADVNGDGQVNVGDLAGILIPFIFGGGEGIIPCGPVTYPLSRTYEWNVFEMDGAPLYTDTLHLKFAGAGSDDWILGAFGNGPVQDSVIGRGNAYDAMSLQNKEIVLDAGFTVDLSVQGDTVAGTLVENTIAGPRFRLVIMHQL